MIQTQTGSSLPPEFLTLRRWAWSFAAARAAAGQLILCLLPESTW